MTTFRELADDIFDQTGVLRGTAIGTAGTVDEEGRQVTRALNAAGDALARRFSWQALLVEDQIQIASNTALYTFAEMPGRIVSAALWIDGAQEFLDGPKDPVQWMAMRRGGGRPGTTYAWRMIGDQVELYPTPPVGGDWLRATIRTRKWARSAAGAPQEAFIAESDVPRLDGNLLMLDGLWRFRRMQGFSYDTERQEAEAAIKRAMGLDQPGRVVIGSTTTYLPDPSIPYSDFIVG